MFNNLSALILFLATVPACETQRTEPSMTPPAPHSQVNAATPAESAPSQPSSTAIDTGRSMTVAGLATCQPTSELTNTVSRAIQLADADGDGQIVRQEAQSMADLLVGGAFFRADQDADGKITPDEGRATRAALLHEHPILAATLARARQMTGQAPFKTLAQLLDVNYGKPLTVAEARSAAKTVVDEFYGFADGDKNGVISRGEALSAGNHGALALGHQAFAAADTNDDRSLSRSEFEQAVIASANPVFQLFDTDRDERLTEQEAAAAINAAGLRFGMPQVPSKG